MGKPRRPRGSTSPGSTSGRRSTFEPRPALDPVPRADTAAAPAPAEARQSIPVERAPEPDPVPAEVVADAVPPALPATVAEPAIPEPIPEPSIGLEAPDASSAPAAGSRIAFTPERLDLADIGATVAGYVRGEGEAAAAHVRALSETRSPADLIRLQVGEIQRAADASLTCWSTVARKVSRIFAFR